MRTRGWWLLVAVLVVACSTPKRNPVPAHLSAEAEIPGFTGIRAYEGKPDEAFTTSFGESMKSEDPAAFPRDADGKRTYPLLLISAGGSNGAYGAGLLAGWTKKGTRPYFKVATGVSTGALLAPFAIAGPKYDDLMKKLYTTLKTDDIIRVRSTLSIPFSESGADTAPLRKLLDEYMDAEFIGAIAEAHARGQRLWIATVNLDSERMVVWDLGEIASRDHPDAHKLFRDVLQAACSVPVAFNPVMMPVEAGGTLYDEMHVDGGVKGQVFLDADTIGFERALDIAGLTWDQTHFQFFVLRNGTLRASYKPIERNLFSIAGRTVSAMLKNMAIRDIYRGYLHTKLNKSGEYYYAAIPDDFVFEGAQEFDPKEMSRLFDRGFNDALTGQPWKTEPPAYAHPPEDLWKKENDAGASGASE